MLRAVSSIYIESQAFELLATYRRDVFKLFRTCSSAPLPHQTVLTSEGAKQQTTQNASRASAEASQAPPPPPPPPPPPARRGWAVAAAVAITASLGGAYYYRKVNEQPGDSPAEVASRPPAPREPQERAEPATGAELPARVQYLLVGGGTASFAAMRAIRSARPDAQVLIVGEEAALPYMRPPLSKELWREPDLAEAARRLESLTFRQWNGKRRSLVYEPAAFYAPVAQLAEGGGGAAVARGWRVTRLRVASNEAELETAGGERAVIAYDKCLVATGSRARRAAALDGARAGARVLQLRAAADAARLAQALADPKVRHVAIVGGGFLASELSAALAERLNAGAEGAEGVSAGAGPGAGPGAEPVRVTQVFREAAPMAGVLPAYLAAEAARRLQRAGVQLAPHTEIESSEASAGRAVLRLAGGGQLAADVVVECVGCAPDHELPARSRLETHPELGGLLVNAELQARSGVWAAGDAACFYDEALGRRRVEHHDHAVVSGRLAGNNMADAAPAQHYHHQSMFWSDLGPDLGYEAIGIVDSRLPTVGVFSADAVSDAEERVMEIAADGAVTSPDKAALVKPAATDAAALIKPATATDDATTRRYERGVVFYVRERRVVGVLLWNLFNRMHVARQVLAQGEFEDLFEVAKLFNLHEDD